MCRNRCSIGPFRISDGKSIRHAIFTDIYGISHTKYQFTFPVVFIQTFHSLITYHHTLTGSNNITVHTGKLRCYRKCNVKTSIRNCFCRSRCSSCCTAAVCCRVTSTASCHKCCQHTNCCKRCHNLLFHNFSSSYHTQFQ